MPYLGYKTNDFIAVMGCEFSLPDVVEEKANFFSQKILKNYFELARELGSLKIAIVSVDLAIRDLRASPVFIEEICVFWSINPQEVMKASLTVRIQLGLVLCPYDLNNLTSRIFSDFTLPEPLIPFVTQYVRRLRYVNEIEQVLAVLWVICNKMHINVSKEMLLSRYHGSETIFQDWVREAARFYTEIRDPNYILL